MVKENLLTSWKFNDVTTLASCDNMGNMMPTAQGALQDFILHFATKLITPIVFSSQQQGANYVYAHCHT